MAGTAKRAHLTGMVESDLRYLVQEFNKLIDDLEAVRNALTLHTHGGVTAGAASTGAPNANIAPIDTAVELLAAKVLDQDGTAP